MLTAVCDHGYVSDWASAMKSLPSEKIFWGGAGNVGNLKAYTEKYMIGEREKSKKETLDVLHPKSWTLLGCFL